MKILGIDPGTHRLGYGVIDVTGQRSAMVTFGCIEPKHTVLAGDHLVTIYQELTTLIAEHRPMAVAIEELYFGKNVTTGLKVAEARGVVILAARQALLPIAEYKPNVIKQSVTGYGMSPKDQIQRMVKLILRLPEIPKPDDAADGLAIAICHSMHMKMSQGLP